MGLLSQHKLKRWLDSNADVRTCSRPQHASLAESDFLPFRMRVRLCDPNDVVGLRINSKYACRPYFTKLEQGSKAAMTLREQREAYSQEKGVTEQEEAYPQEKLRG